ncbi:preprotein translocase subunit SecE [Candidatus Gracilibacteria bacterium]|nr:preprotein translocase subunit SecE [Candidatus Gracilibacteria bacterium]
MKFIKDSFRELQHVVWPTRAETKKYFLTIIIFIVLFGLYLFVFNNIFGEIIIQLKNIF